MIGSRPVGSDTTAHERSLCPSCDPPGPCAMVADKDQPVHHCEEYQPSVAPSRQRENGRPQEPPYDWESYRGLCVTCGNRASCTFPKPEGGVWHCEEFV